MTITFPSEACAFTFTWKTDLLLTRQFKNKGWMKAMCQDTTPILGCSAVYCGKHSQNRKIDSHWALKHIKGVRNGGVGVNPSPWAWYFTKTLLPAQRSLIVFAYFCLLICRLNANNKVWICPQISRNSFHGPKSNN